MLGLAYQGQGQLDLAWDKFRQVPLSDAVLDNLYNLALDFERKRQFNKAESVFRYMARVQPEVPRPGAEAVARQEAVGDGDPRRRLEPPRRLACNLGAGARSRCSAAIEVREGARQGRDGRGLPGQGPEDRPRGGDQDHGAVAGVRGRRAGRGEGALLPRGGDRGAPVAPEHRHHLRRRRGARPAATSRWSC